MQFFLDLLRVVFVLSTIVAVTDCCSSRILLLQQHSLKLVHDHSNFQEPDDLDDHAQLPSHKLPHHIKIEADIDLNRNHSRDESTRDNATSISTTTESTPPDQLSSTGLKYSSDIESSTALPNTHEPIDEKEFITDPAVREKYAGNPKYHIIDVYYAIMRDVLSIECSAEFRVNFCLNRGRCFRYPVGNASFYSCECADGYVGERCESKSINGEIYMPSPPLGIKQPKILMARIVFSFPMLIAITVIYIMIGAVVLFKRPPKQRAPAGLDAERRGHFMMNTFEE